MIPEKTRNKTIDDLLKVVSAGKTFFLSGHDKPDGDTVGCELAFASLLKRLGKKVSIANAEPVPPNLLFLPGVKRIKSTHHISGHFDVAVIFECTGQDRMGNILDFKTQATRLINIDHHLHHVRFADINLIDPDSSSNSEILIHVFQRAGLPLTKEEATALYVGLVTDSGRFQQSNTNVQSHEAAAVLLSKGVDVADISRRVFGTRSEPSLRLLAKGISSMRLSSLGRVAQIIFSRTDFQETGADSDDVEDVINHALLIPTVETVVMVRPAREDGKSKVSLRGKGVVDLLRIAVSHGGGGHRNACGCTLQGNEAFVAGKLTKEVERLLPRYSRRGIAA